MAERLLAKKGDDHSEERSSQTQPKDEEDAGECGVGAIPLRENGAGWEVLKQDAEVGFVLNGSDEHRCGHEDCNSLSPPKNILGPPLRIRERNTHGDQRGIQGSIVFLDVVTVIHFGCVEKHRVELGADGAGGPRRG